MTDLSRQTVERLAADLRAGALLSPSETVRDEWKAAATLLALLSELESARERNSEDAKELRDGLLHDARLRAEKAEAELEGNRLCRYFKGLDQDDADKRAEHIMQTSLDGLMVGPLNRNGIKALLAEHFADLMARAARAESALAEAQQLLADTQECVAAMVKPPEFGARIRPYIAERALHDFCARYKSKERSS